VAHIYLDTSVLMALICPEPETECLLGWYRTGAHQRLIVTPWVRTELANAISIKQRSRQLNAQEASVALHTGRRLLLTAYAEPLLTEDFDLAADLCAQADSKLRGPDALHLAAARRLGCTEIATLDGVMQDAARGLGVYPVDFGFKIA